MKSRMATSGGILAVVVATLLATVTEVNADTVTYAGTIGGDGAARHSYTPGFTVNPLSGSPVIIEGWIDLGNMPHNSAVMIGLMDTVPFYNNLLGGPDSQGVWAYFGYRDSTPANPFPHYRIGASNGQNGGELISGGTVIPVGDLGGHDTSSIISFKVIIDDTTITFMSGGFSEQMNYSNLSLSDSATVYVDAWFASESQGQDYEITVTVVPLPAAAWAGLTLLGGVGGARVWRRRKLA